ncbi:MAG: hypothetical protein ACFCUG_02400 [Thiotrichales bacterium]
MSEVKIEILLKRRIVGLRAPCDPNYRAHAAAHLLSDTHGIHLIELVGEYQLEVGYNLFVVTLEQIETALSEVGFHLDNSLFYKLKRALYYYTEANERSNLGLERLSCSQNCARRIFASRYEHIKHGCRDNRPDHLRRYL